MSFIHSTDSLPFPTLSVDPGFGEKVLQHEAAFEGAVQRRGVPAVVRRHLVRGEIAKTQPFLWCGQKKRISNFDFLTC